VRGVSESMAGFRDEQSLEVDSVTSGPRGAIRLVECKASRTSGDGASDATTPRRHQDVIEEL